jgi:hypothetical protein
VPTTGHTGCMSGLYGAEQRRASGLYRGEKRASDNGYGGEGGSVPRCPYCSKPAVPTVASPQCGPRGGDEIEKTTSPPGHVTLEPRGPLPT